MLKSPTFSSAQAFVFPARTSSKQNTNVHTNTINTTHPEKPSHGGDSRPEAVYEDIAAEYISSRAVLTPNIAPNTLLNKAQSSLASSSYQAQGFLPHHGGAGKASVASLYSDQAPPSPVRVSLPSQASYGDKPIISPQLSCDTHEGANIYNASTILHNSVNFGFDGGADAPPAKDLLNSSNDPDYDYQGVTVADFEIKRPDPDSAWHKGEVEDFFRDLAQEEETDIMSRRRENTQSAA